MSAEDLLIKRAQSGDIAAFEALIEAYEQKVFHIAYRMAGNPDDAADMAQEILLKIFRNVGKFKGESKFSTWVYRVATNTCLDELKKAKRKAAYSLDEEFETEEGQLGVEVADTAPTPEQRVEGQEIRDAITEAISRLSEEHRQIIILRDINGLTYEEVADILDCSLGTVKSRISRAREQLRKILSQDRELFERYYV